MFKQFWAVNLMSLQTLPQRLGASSVIVIGIAVVALLAGSDAFTPLKDALSTNPQLKVDVLRESDYCAAQSKPLSNAINVVGNTVAVIMAIGAMFAARSRRSAPRECPWRRHSEQPDARLRQAGPAFAIIIGPALSPGMSA